jgi:hypothetical protein
VQDLNREAESKARSELKILNGKLKRPVHYNAAADAVAQRFHSGEADEGDGE